MGIFFVLVVHSDKGFFFVTVVHRNKGIFFLCSGYLQQRYFPLSRWFTTLKEFSFAAVAHGDTWISHYFETKKLYFRNKAGLCHKFWGEKQWKVFVTKKNPALKKLVLCNLSEIPHWGNIMWEVWVRNIRFDHMQWYDPIRWIYTDPIYVRPYITKFLI